MYQYVKSSPAPVLACHPPSRWIPQRQADGHDATHAPPAATLAPVPPTGGAVAPGGAHVRERGPILGAKCRQHFIGGNFCWSVARCASQRRARKSLILE